MRHRHSLLFFYFIFIFFETISAQSKIIPDSAGFSKDLEEVIFTATKSERKLSNIAIPVSVISKNTIVQNGSLRLDNILGEQAGLFITNAFGSGVQMQGLNPDYTLILLDGEPLIGRTSGVLDLSRVALYGIKKIEIVKGPSSSLYGSEALAGVINIITDKPAATNASGSIRYGSFGTADINAAAGLVKRNLNLSVQANRYSTDGYNLNNTGAQTQDPFHNCTFHLKSDYRLSPKTRWIFNARYFKEKQVINPYTLKDAANNSENITGNASIGDINVINTFEHIFSGKIKSQLRLYYTSYKAITNQYFVYADTAQNSSYFDYFHQQFLRAETQTDFALSKNLDISAGGGWILDNVRSNRYDDAETVSRKNNTSYFFSQCEWRVAPGWNITAGLRYDHNDAYESRFSPKIAIQKKMGRLSLNASIGNGFKAPDFRQLYLNFTNAAVGYTVLGNTEVTKGFNRLQQQGQILSVLIDPSSIKPLRPETSTGINLGARYKISKNISLDVNLFRNDITNLIITGMIAQKTNSQFVYSYFNVNRAYTKGMEANLSWQLTKNLKVEAGYQLLYSADKDQLAAIKSGAVFGRDNGNVYRLTKKDYNGLFDRSTHMANFKIYYENRNGLFANVRNIYRSSWGVDDVDGNLYLNRGDRFAKGYIQTNISAGKTFKSGFGIQGGSDNIFNYRDKLYLLEEPGRILYATITYSFTHNQKK